MPHTIDREAVRLLVMQIGCKDAASQLGLSYARVRQWSCRYKWLKKIQPPNPNSNQYNQHVTAVTPPSSILAKLGEQTKLSFAKSMNRMAKDSETANLRDSPYVHKAIQGAAIVHGWNEQQQSNTQILNLAVLTGKTELPDASKKSITDV